MDLAERGHAFVSHVGAFCFSGASDGGGGSLPFSHGPPRRWEDHVPERKDHASTFSWSSFLTQARIASEPREAYPVRLSRPRKGKEEVRIVPIPLGSVRTPSSRLDRFRWIVGMGMETGTWSHPDHRDRCGSKRERKSIDGIEASIEGSFRATRIGRGRRRGRRKRDSRFLPSLFLLLARVDLL